MELASQYIKLQSDAAGLKLNLLAEKTSVTEEQWNAIINDKDSIVIDHYKDCYVFAYKQDRQRLSEKHGLIDNVFTLDKLLEDEVLFYITDHMNASYPEIFLYEDVIRNRLKEIIGVALADMKEHVTDDLFGTHFMDNLYNAIEEPVLKAIAGHMIKQANEYFEAAREGNRLTKLFTYK